MTNHGLLRVRAAGQPSPAAVREQYDKVVNLLPGEGGGQGGVAPDSRIVPWSIFYGLQNGKTAQLRTRRAQEPTPEEPSGKKHKEAALVALAGP